MLFAFHTFFFLPFEVFRDRAKEDDIKRRYKKSMTCSIRIKCEGRSAIFELVLRADLMTLQDGKQQCPTDEYLLLVCT